MDQQAYTANYYDIVCNTINLVGRSIFNIVLELLLSGGNAIIKIVLITFQELALERDLPTVLKVQNILWNLR